MIGNSLNVSKLREVLQYELKRETKYQPIFSIPQQDKNAVTLEERDKIVSHLLTLNKQFGFHPESFALAASILDRFLYLVKAQKKYLPCIVVACYFLAVKIIEEEEDLPGASELLDAIGCSFSVSDLLRMERIILAKLDWDLNRVTALSFLQAFHALSVASGCVSPHAVPHHLQLLTNKLELLLCQHEFLSYRPSTLALALMIQDLNSSLRQWIHLVQSFQTEIKVPEWELNACFIAVSGFLDMAFSYDDDFAGELDLKNVDNDEDLKLSEADHYKCSSPLIRALALETNCSFEFDAKIPPNNVKISRMLSAVA
ncbi:cyclin-I-like [Dendronephthya gigantea]|uniref:cyclin-I-like n=1 Tax=Dendronephthya gigantea TaxID=151771 RepID=UPI00106DAEEA|nr:cyclin-I-like [Dendronephthya gigantea]XP_028401593.1 cyclin-I-like [Dendronephthya gigantea]